MMDLEALLQRFDDAVNKHVKDGTAFSKETARDFKALQALILPFAEAGNMHCQYKLAFLVMLGVCYESESEYNQYYERDELHAATWLMKAAKQGHPYALDNLITSRNSPEHETIRKCYDEVKLKLGVGSECPAFINELYKHVSGREYTREWVFLHEGYRWQKTTPT